MKIKDPTFLDEFDLYFFLTALLSLDSRSPNSLTVKWEPPTSHLTSHKYKLSIECPAISYSADYSMGGDRGTFNFSKLPEITGTGETYEVKVVYIVTPAGDDEEVNH